MVWACNSKGSWTNRHQMTVNGKRDRFERADLLAVSDAFGIKGAAEMIEQVTEAVAAWRPIATECGIGSALLKKIATTHRTSLAGR